MTSDRVEQLDAHAEVFYRRLLNRCDDFGLFDGRLSILRSTLYPLRLDRVREADLQRWIAACVKAGLIVLYESSGKPYLKVLDTRWPERTEPKFPPPTDDQLATANGCQQVLALSVSKSVSISKSIAKAVPNRAPPRPPSSVVVSEFMQTLGLSQAEASKEAEAFWDHFSSNGWKVGGKAPMQDWAAAARGWVKRRHEYQKSDPSPPGPTLEELKARIKK